MTITKDSFLPFLMFNKPIQYNKHITLYPVTMNDVLLFQTLSRSITVRKNSVFHEKSLIKMTYLEFLTYAYMNEELEAQYAIYGLSQYLILAIQLLKLCCQTTDIAIDRQTGNIVINDEILTSEIFDDLRRIIIIQNDIDFDIDEFLNYDTEQRLLKAENDLNRDKITGNTEDYIDSLVIALHVTEEQIMNMTVRKFWRYVKRFRLHENYTILKTGECSGMVSFKEPIKYWMISLEEEDRYEHLKTDEDALRSKIG